MCIRDRYYFHAVNSNTIHSSCSKIIVIGLFPVDTEYAEFNMPEFFGDSYIEAPKLENVGRAFSLEIWFLPASDNGVLIYNGQVANGKGDFISLNLVNGHVQFRFDLGSGIANIT